MNGAFNEVNEVIDLQSYLQGETYEQQEFIDSLIYRLHNFGFFYLKVKRELNDDIYHPNMFLERYITLFTDVLSEHPFLKLYMDAPTVDDGGYSLVFFPEVSDVDENIDYPDQPIESMLSLPLLWEWSRNKGLPKKIKNFLKGTEDIYHMIYKLSFILIDALERGYNNQPGSLKKLFEKKNNGSVRFVKYHKPNCFTDIDNLNIHITEPTIPHIDKSFFSFNLGETSPGLFLIEDGKKQALSIKSDCLLVTSGSYSEELTLDSKYPIRGFKHTVLNSVERIVGLGFVAPDF
ncbi:hypothetical protein [Nostoc sp. TCL26-01]|uniref:hypothetical protein n=1 Tax=Nostoc sp. TCL26-01 TaxID=2576904 RepID=UPI0015B9678A|nr:hypothetical protein [Nostoc sp. TCL26-01]QLE60006.1 hypothetical protein FD725_31875 [Nostoc sp. TCL26-01]